MIITKKIPLSYLLRNTYQDFFVVLLFSFTAFIIHHYTTFFTIPLGLSTFLGTAISLVLSFNLSLSYDRWWEARKIWGAVVNDSRALILQLKSFSDETEKIEKMALYQITWVHVLRQMLRDEPLDDDVKKYLTEKECAELDKADHKVLAINENMRKCLHSFNTLNSYERVQIDTTIVRLISHLGMAERINKTVFPQEYQLVLHLSIYLFLGFLSISLANLGHHWEIFLLVIIAAPFFLLEKTATHLQDPFNSSPTDVPISNISQTIEINLLHLIHYDKIPQRREEKEFYIN